MFAASTLVWFLARAVQDPAAETISSPFADGTTISVRQVDREKEGPKLSPKHEWKFDRLWIASLVNGDAKKDRIRVFSQTPENPAMTAKSVARFMARLYDFNMTVLRLDHNLRFNNQQVDAYLANEGPGGGEQMFCEDPTTVDQYGQVQKVNVLFIYDVDTLKDSVEACREVAHEYGHATLPFVRVTQGREQWANGHLGERLYLTWFRDQFKKSLLKPSDGLGINQAGLDAYFGSKVKPLITRILTSGPPLDELNLDNDKAFEAYLAVALYAYSVLPAEPFRRSLVLADNDTPLGFEKALVEAVGERPKVSLRPPFSGVTEFWAPVGKALVSGGKVIERRGNWAKIRASAPVTLLNKSKD